MAKRELEKQELKKQEPKKQESEKYESEKQEPETQKAEKQSLEVCIREYGRDVYSFCSYLARNRQEADDLYQDTFLKAMELEGKLDLDNNPRSYLLSIALRLWKNRKRKYAWRNRIAPVQSIMEEKDGEPEAVFHEETEVSPEERLLDREERLAVRLAVDRLPDRLRAAVLLYYMEELPVKEIAAVMRIPAGTVLSRLYQARKILRKELEGVLDE